MIKNFLAKILFVIITLISFGCLGQSLLLPLNYQHNLYLNELILRSDSLSIHTGFKPLIASNPKDAATNYDADTGKYYYGLTQKVFKENLIIIEDDNFNIKIDPLFNFSFGQDIQDSVSRNLTRNTRGFQVQGEIGKKIGFYSSFYENQSIEPQYINNYIKQTGVAPGQGRVKPYKKGKGYDYAMASGYFSYSPINSLNIQFGHHKNFIGHGYRSMLWSDVGFNYPFLKATTTFFKNKLSYTTIFGLFQSLKRLPVTNSTEALFERKGGNIHYLSFLPHHRIEIGIFESLLYQRKDTTKVTSLPYNYFLPIIGINSGLIGKNSKDNTSLGLNLKLKLSSSLSAYGQLIFNNLKNNDFGYQFGFNLYSPFGVKNLYLLAEFNTSEGNSGSTKTNFPYFHYNQPFAHPLNKEFREILGILNYQINRFYIQLKSTDKQNKYQPTMVLRNL